jgi:CrcB protein
VNVAGALALGCVATRYAIASRPQRLLGTGFCGALTTFSAMQLELLEMLDADRYALAATYAAGSVAAGLAAVALTTSAVRRRTRGA